MNATNTSRQFICSTRPFSPNISRTFYLLSFVSMTLVSVESALSILHDIWRDTPATAVARFIGHSIYYFVAIAFLFHMIRLYVTIEDLDDPHSEIFKASLRRLDRRAKIWERLIRAGAFVILVGLFGHYLHYIYERPVGTQQQVLLAKHAMMHTAFLITAALYLLLSLWDALIFFFSLDEKSKPTYFWSSIGGLVCAGSVWILLPQPNSNNDGNWELIAIFLCVGAVAIYWSLVQTVFRGMSRKLLCRVLRASWELRNAPLSCALICRMLRGLWVLFMRILRVQFRHRVLQEVRSIGGMPYSGSLCLREPKIVFLHDASGEVRVCKSRNCDGAAISKTKKAIVLCTIESDPSVNANSVAP